MSLGPNAPAASVDHAAVDPCARTQLPVEFAGPPLRCTGCGYDLRGLPSGGQCPECGKSVVSSISETTHRVIKPEAPVAAAAGTACVRCGGDVGGFTSHDACPGCTAPVWLSLDGDWLCVRDPAWLRRVRRGVTLWAWKVALSLAVYVIAVMASFAWSFLWRGVSPSQLFAWIRISEPILRLAGALLVSGAAVLLTTPHPGARASDKATLPHIIRALMLINVACVFLSRVLPWLAPEVYGRAQPELPVLTLAVSGLLCLGMITYTRALSRQLPADRLVRRLTVALWGLGASYVVGLLEAMALQSISERGSPWLWALQIGNGVSGLAYLVFNAWLAVALVRFRRALHDIAAPGTC